MTIFKIMRPLDSVDCEGANWVARALKRPGMGKDYRFHTNCIKCENGRLTATNGERMHRYLLRRYKLPDGYYKVQIANRSKVVLRHIPFTGEYPDVESMFRVPQDNEDYELIHGYKANKDRTSVSKMYTEIVRSMTDSMTVKYEYLHDALADGAFFDVHFSYCDHTKPLILKDSMNVKMAVIMPILL